MKRNLSTFFGFASIVFIAVSILLFGLFDEDTFQLVSKVHAGLALVSLVLFFFLGGLKKGGALREGSQDGRSRFEKMLRSLYVVLVLLSIILGGYAVRSYLPFRYDATEEKVFSLSSHTLQILQSLDRPILVRAFFIGGEVKSEVRRLLDQYAQESVHFRWTAVDPDKQRPLVEALGIQEKETLHFSFRDSKEAGITLVRMLDEETVTNSILKLQKGKKTTIYAPQAHGEGNLLDPEEAGFSFLRESIEGEGYSIVYIDLMLSDEIPLEDSMLLVLAPRRDFLPGEKLKIEQYLLRGGNAFFLLEPRFSEQISSIVAPYGFLVGNDTVVDREAFTFKDGVLGVQPLIDAFAVHPSVDGFNKTIIMSTALSVRKAPMGDQVSEIAFTSETSWAETNLDDLYSETPMAEKGESDISGPVAIASVLEKEKDGSLQRISVLGDLDFVANINIRQLFNRDFFLNILNWTVGEDEGVSIRAGKLRGSQQIISPDQFQLIFLIAGVLLPQVLLLLGIYVWVSRR